MAFHIKSTTKFKALIGFSALSVSGVAALFSVTGVSTLFKGAWLAVVIMMGILEFAKIIVASYLARFWTDISKSIRTYFVVAILILMLITSAGIFGYLSEAYQGTKGNYDVTEQESGALSSKRKNYEEQIQRYKDRVFTLNSFRAGQEVRLDSLYSKGLTTSAKRVETNIQRNDVEVQSLNDKITSLTDSVGNIGTQIITKQSVNIKGELGPLKFIASAFGTEMDTVVKYLIFMLIFVFDPLAVLLFVSLSIMIRKETETEILSDKPIKEEPLKEEPLKKVLVDEKVSKFNISETKVQPITEDVQVKVEPKEVVVEIKEEDSPEEKELHDVVESLLSKVIDKEPEIEVPTEVQIEVPIEVITEVPVEEPIKPIEEITEPIIEKIEEPIVPHEENAHTFYYGGEPVTASQEIVVQPPTPEASHVNPVADWKTSNWKGH